MSRKLTAVVFSLGCLHASSSFALGLGDLQIDSFLNEPLKAKVDLLNTAGLHPDEIHIRLANRQDFERMGVDRAYFLTSIQFKVNIDPSGRGTITMTSEDPVLEPYLDFIVEARWPSGRLLREYTVLVDPPTFDSGATVVSASKRVEEVEGIPAPESEAKKTEGAAATSGTQVDVRKSDLGPGEMPQRDFNSAAAGAPAPGSKYMIHRDDTLWQIASRARPEGASVNQTMLDIQRLNPDAFINGNINQIKAGYIIYLPKSADISSQDQEAALAEVKQQNEDWRAGRASSPASARPSLRISAEPEEDGGAAGDIGASSSAAADESAGADMDSAAASGSAEDAAETAAELADTRSELSRTREQVTSLERMVSLKDQQIAELQEKLAKAGTSSQAGGEAAAAKPKPKPRPVPPVEKSGGWMSYGLYGLGALVLAALAFFFVRSRRSDDEEESGNDDAFNSVKLKTPPAPPPAREPAPVAEEPLENLVDDSLDDDIQSAGFDEPVAPFADAEAPPAGRSGDYGADDGDSGDALAEADIYIAYGRYPQARELLRSALVNEPDNTAYRLKLLEAELQLGNRPAAREQLYELEARGDAAATARARELLGEADSYSEPPAGLAEEVGGSLESDFAGLEIEGGLGDDDSIEDDLDLSSDFMDSPLGDEEEDDDEDLVIAADSNGMSTKLDLARAYLDMGDEEGARQILEEVVAEGSEEYRSEAEALLARID